MNIEIAEIIQKFSNILILDASISEEEFKIFLERFFLQSLILKS